jgi:hypothetical protein
VEFIFDKGSFYNLPSILESTFKWSEFDREEFFLVHAGALDQPKLTLKEVQWSESGCKMILGMASFHDVFFTNYSPDLVISTQPSNEGDKFNRHTVRSIIGRAIEEHYESSIQSTTRNRQLKLSSLSPNPLGISGIMILKKEESSYVILRGRATNEIAAQGMTEWSYAGLIDAANYYHCEKINSKEILLSECIDEVVKANNLTSFEADKIKVEVIGMTINPLWLYQPELYALIIIDYRDNPKLYEEILEKVVENNKTSFYVKEARELESHFNEKKRKRKLKNLCYPGLALLKASHPELFR